MKKMWAATVACLLALGALFFAAAFVTWAIQTWIGLIMKGVK